MNIKLACDYYIWMEKYYFSKTYEGYFHLPRMNKKINQNIISRAKRIAKRILGEWPGLVISPEVKMVDWAENPFPVLPMYLCMALFMSIKFTGEYSKTRLAIVWFQNDPDHFISEKAMAKIKNINWPKYAQEFDY